MSEERENPDSGKPDSGKTESVKKLRTSTRAERFKQAFSKGQILGTVERAIGIWYPGPNDVPDDTNPELQAVFAAHVEKRLGAAYSCAAREVREPGTPNLIILSNRTQKRYDAVTCYRSQMFIGEDGEPYLPWTTQETYDKLLNFAEEEEADIYVVIGLHGFADAPKFLFCVPLKDAAIDLKKSVLSAHEIKEDGVFFQ